MSRGPLGSPVRSQRAVSGGVLDASRFDANISSQQVLTARLCAQALDPPFSRGSGLAEDA